MTDPAPVEAEITVEAYAALSEDARAALDITKTKRKKLDKNLATLNKRVAKAAAAAAAGNAPAAGGDKKPRAKKEKKEAAPLDETRIGLLETPKGEKKRLNIDMAPTYRPGDVESGWYDWWDAQGFFKEDGKEALEKIKQGTEVFSMVIPPPNVTGSLHLGHALMLAIQDALTRWHRMSGRIAMYVPGVDHAGIATQVVVEKQLKRLGLPGRLELGREGFCEEVFKWKEEYGGKICQQIRRMGSGLDWDREEFTMSEKLNKAVTEAFVRFYDEGLVYRAMRLVNWSCALKTAISDIEVNTIELAGPTMLKVPGEEQEVEFGVIISFAYRLVEEEGKDGGELVVATTRLETMLGDVAVAVHPDDKRYAHLVGRKLVHPFVADREVVIITDGQLVDMELGTGAVKVTPAHDPNDYACGKRNSLPEINMLTDDGCVAECGGPQFAGMRRYAARTAIASALDKLGLLREKVSNPMSLGLCSRSGDVVEPLLKEQWWVNCSDLAKRSMDAVENGELKLVPARAKATWDTWLGNIQDWCVSRQLWWGHRIPAYEASVEGKDSVWVVGRTEDEALKRAAEKFGSGIDQASITLRQDEDVLDTWFSSGLFPFSVFGWPEKTPDMDAFFPTSVLETGSDILFFWVARMVMMSLGLTGKLPFHTVVLHSMVRDKRGKKMSKSVGNVVDPLYLIDGTSKDKMLEAIYDSNLSKSDIETAVADRESEFPGGIPICGADSLRMGLLSYMTSAGDINLDVQNVVEERAFGNKLWNAVRFAIMNLGSEFQPSVEGLQKALTLGNVMDRWMLSRANAAAEKAHTAFQAYDFGGLHKCVTDYWLADLCSQYVEAIKPVLKGTDEAAKEAARQVLHESLWVGLRLLHPMMPFITEELYHRLPGKKSFDSIVVAPYPVFDESRCDPSAERSLEVMKEIVTAIRSIGKDSGIKPQDRPAIFVLAADADAASLISPDFVTTLASCGEVQVVTPETVDTIPQGCGVKVLSSSFTVHVSVQGLTDPATELRKLDAEATKKRLAIETIEKKQCGEGYAERVPEKIRDRDSDNLTKRKAELEGIERLAASFQALL